MAISSKQLEEDMFDTMWAFLQMGKQIIRCLKNFAWNSDR